MSTTALDLNRFSFKPEEKLLIDVNVLIYLQSGNSKKYDKVWEKAKKQGNQLYFTALSISEFINYFTKTGYKQYLREYNKREE
ncbi:TPA: type II toxin-antitoxin system VapC family toxin, partial [Streptococcus pyogenes]